MILFAEQCECLKVDKTSSILKNFKLKTKCNFVRFYVHHLLNLQNSMDHWKAHDYLFILNDLYIELVFIKSIVLNSNSYTLFSLNYLVKIVKYLYQHALQSTYTITVCLYVSIFVSSVQKKLENKLTSIFGRYEYQLLELRKKHIYFVQQQRRILNLCFLKSHHVPLYSNQIHNLISILLHYLRLHSIEQIIMIVTPHLVIHFVVAKH